MSRTPTNIKIIFFVLFPHTESQRKDKKKRIFFSIGDSLLGKVNINISSNNDIILNIINIFLDDIEYI